MTTRPDLERIERLAKQWSGQYNGYVHRTPAIVRAWELIAGILSLCEYLKELEKERDEEKAAYNGMYALYRDLSDIYNNFWWPAPTVNITWRITESVGTWPTPTPAEGGEG